MTDVSPLLEDIARPSKFPFDRDSWPGRELYWCWRNPLLTALFLVGAVVETVHLVTM